jgi:hypothetical protein
MGVLISCGICILNARFSQNNFTIWSFMSTYIKCSLVFLLLPLFFEIHSNELHTASFSGNSVWVVGSIANMLELNHKPLYVNSGGIIPYLGSDKEPDNPVFLQERIPSSLTFEVDMSWQIWNLNGQLVKTFYAKKFPIDHLTNEMQYLVIRDLQGNYLKSITLNPMKNH